VSAPTWNAVAPLLSRWHLALVPHRDGTWDVLAFGGGGLQVDARRVPFPALPQAIADVAVRCDAAARAREP
jgi:hypothetical protein